MIKIAALLYGTDFGHLDHLAPYCSLQNIPLYVTNERVYHLANAQYTNLSTLLAHPNSVAEILVSQFDHIITTLPKGLIEPILLFDETVSGKKMTTSWLPHGASDKKNLAVLEKEQELLVYGKKMIDDLPSCAASKCKQIGNFRKTYFEQHHAFYKILVENAYPNIKREYNALYAPSWEDPDIPKWAQALILHKPQNQTLYIKLHPNSYKKGFATSLEEKYLEAKNVYFIKDFYPIYPLLSYMNYLITDISSIGYDFLSFNKPLFFTSKKKEPLHSCGETLSINSPYEKTHGEPHTTAIDHLYRLCFRP